MVLKYTRKYVWLIGLMMVLSAMMTNVIAEEATNPDEPIRNLQFQSADIRSVMTFLAEYGNINVVVAPKVSGSVTITLKNVHWKNAMEIIGNTYDLAVVFEGDEFVRVLRNEDFRKEMFDKQQHEDKTRKLTPLETRIVRISNSTSDDMVQAVKSLLTSRGQATSDARSNSIILQEVPDNLEQVIGYIKELDRPARQIKISTQLLELFTTDLEDIGINWSVQGVSESNSGNTIDQLGQSLGNRSADIMGQYSIASVQHGWTASAIVEAIVNSGKGKVIAHPEITTIDNKQARIQMGQKIPVKQFDVSGNVVIEFEEVGTILLVTPHITAENRILMHLKPERSTYQFDPNGVIINTNNAETNVIVSNGQTSVIGGLTTEDEVETVIGVPFLKDIPLLGRIFKYTNRRYESRDLVIFVTPTIVDEDLAMDGN